jgi:hypothetical protein
VDESCVSKGYTHMAAEVSHTKLTKHNLEQFQSGRDTCHTLLTTDVYRSLSQFQSRDVSLLTIFTLPQHPAYSVPHSPSEFRCGRTPTVSCF